MVGTARTWRGSLRRRGRGSGSPARARALRRRTARRPRSRTAAAPRAARSPRHGRRSPPRPPARARAPRVRRAAGGGPAAAAAARPSAVARRHGAVDGLAQPARLLGAGEAQLADAVALATLVDVGLRPFALEDGPPADVARLEVVDRPKLLLHHADPSAAAAALGRLQETWLIDLVSSANYFSIRSGVGRSAPLQRHAHGPPPAPAGRSRPVPHAGRRALHHRARRPARPLRAGPPGTGPAAHDHAGADPPVRRRAGHAHPGRARPPRRPARGHPRGAARRCATCGARRAPTWPTASPTSSPTSASCWPRRAGCWSGCWRTRSDPPAPILRAPAGPRLPPLLHRPGLRPHLGVGAERGRAVAGAQAHRQRRVAGPDHRPAVRPHAAVRRLGRPAGRPPVQAPHPALRAGVDDPARRGPVRAHRHGRGRAVDGLPAGAGPRASATPWTTPSARPSCPRSSSPGSSPPRCR